MPTVSLTGRVVAITGGARGIGAATAEHFVRAGARVAIGDVDVELATRTAAGIGCHAGHLDVTERDSVAAFLDGATAQLGPVDVVVNNAGIMPVVALTEESQASVARQLAINIEGVIYGTQLAVEHMRSRGGHIVNIASAAGLIGFGGVATYTATKFAVAGFTDAAALELRSAGIHFTTVYPAMVRTELAAGLPDHWLLRSCEPAVVAAAIVDGVRRQRRAVYVPRRLGAVAAASRTLPASGRDRLMRLLGADHQMLAGDRVQRAEYDRRLDG